MVATPGTLTASLKVACPRKELYEAVQTVGHAVSGRSTLPILSHILIQSEEDGLRLIATDLELGISCKIPKERHELSGTEGADRAMLPVAEIFEIGALTAPSKTLSEVLGNLSDREPINISLRAIAGSASARINSPKASFRDWDKNPLSSPRFFTQRETER